MSDGLRFGVIGTNFISDRFVDAVAQTAGVTVSAVISRRRETADAFADKYGITARFDDLNVALSSGTFDALYIATPNYTHKDIALRALDAGKHVLCEKIIADSLCDFSQMRKRAEEKGLVLLEAMRPAFDPAYDVIRTALPRLGKIRRASLEYDQYSSRYDAFRGGEVLPAFDPAIGNNALADIGIYPLHTAVALFGEMCDVRSLGVSLENGFHATGTILLKPRNFDMTVTVTYSKITNSVLPSVIEGEEGALTFAPISAPSTVVLHPRNANVENLYETTLKNNMIYEISAFLGMVKGEKTTAFALACTAETLKVYDAVKKAF